MTSRHRQKLVETSFSERIIQWFAICSFVTAMLLLAEDYVIGIADSTDTVTLLAVRHLTGHNSEASTALHELMLFLTELGAFPTLALVTVALAGILTRAGRVAMAVRLLIVTGFGTGIANLLKPVIGRPRPEIVTHWAFVTSDSFPSGHAADSAVVYLTLAYLAESIFSAKAARFSIAAALSLVICIGLSRLYLGVHWPTDILGGWCFGAAWAAAAIHFLRPFPKTAVSVDR